MEISGKIIVELPLQTGVSKSGNNWSRKDYVIETVGQYSKKIAFSVMNDNIDKLGLALNQDVDIQIDIDARGYNGKWYNSINCWKAVLRNPAQQAVIYQQDSVQKEVGKTNKPIEPFTDTQDNLPF